MPLALPCLSQFRVCTGMVLDDRVAWFSMFGDTRRQGRTVSDQGGAVREEQPSRGDRCALQAVRQGPSPLPQSPTFTLTSR